MKLEQQKDIKDEAVTATTMQKFWSKVYFIFLGTDKMNKVINRSIISNTYQQIIEIVHVTLLYTWFGNTNNLTFDIIQTIFSGLLFAICFVPRLFSKYYAFLLTVIAFTFVSIASAAASILLIINYLTFEDYCSILSGYAQKNSNFQFKASNLCSQITVLYQMHLGSEGMICLIRLGYIYLLIQAYNMAKEIFNSEETKRRRKEKYDENLKNKNPFSANRKI